MDSSDLVDDAGASAEIKTQGLCQGNGAASARWAGISITILHMHKWKGHGARFVCLMSLMKGQVATILYVDDTDEIHINLEEEESVFEAHNNLQESVLSWGNLLPEKCFWS